MRVFAVFALAVSVAYGQELSAQERAQRAVVRIEAVEPAFERVAMLIRQRAPAEELRRVKLQQPYKLVTSGVVISRKGEILTTALHPRAQLRIDVIFFDGSHTQASLVGTDPRSNLALIRVAAPVAYHLDLAPGEPSEGTNVQIIGDGTALEGITQMGAVAARHVTVFIPNLYGVDRRQPMLPLASVFAVPVRVGDARPGSPCVDGDGRMLGLLIGRSAPFRRVWPDAQGRQRALEYEYCFALPVARLQRVLKDLRSSHKRVVRSRWDVQLTRVPAAVRAHFELPTSAALVIGIQRAGPADRGGVQLHDVLFSVNGETYKGFYQLAEALSDCRPETPAKLGVLRKGKRVELTVTPSRQEAK